MSTLRRRRVGGEDGDDSAAPQPRITLEAFDLYTKTRTEEAVQSTRGGGLSMIALLLCAALAASEIWAYAIPRTKEHLAVDPVVEDRLRIDFDITFHALPCSEANIDAMDVAGEQQNGLDHDISKTRLSSAGVPLASAYAHRIEAARAAAAEAAAATPLPSDYCGPCYGAGAEGACCNSCDAVRSAYAERGWDVASVTASAEQCAREHRNVPAVESAPGEGCRLAGHMYVNKVAGNFHVAIGDTHARGAGHIHQFNPSHIATYNASHTVHTLSFGEPYPGMRNPLDGTKRIIAQGSGVFMYYLKVVPTVYDATGAISAAFSLQAGQGGGSASSAASAAGSVIARDAVAHSDTLKTNQFSVLSQYRPSVLMGQRMNVIPGVFFVYDISPFMVTVTRHSTSFLTLVTSLAAILGGVLTLARALDWAAGVAFDAPALRRAVSAAVGAAVSVTSSGSPPGSGQRAKAPVQEHSPSAALFGAAGEEARRAAQAAPPPPALTPPSAAVGYNAPHAAADFSPGAAWDADKST